MTIKEFRDRVRGKLDEARNARDEYLKAGDANAAEVMSEVVHALRDVQTIAKELVTWDKDMLIGTNHN